MKRTLILFVLFVLTALSAQAQSGEVGALIGGSRRFISDGAPLPGEEHLGRGFSFSNRSFDIYWATRLEEQTLLKLKVGRIETPVAFAVTPDAGATTYRQDVEGEVQHVSIVVDYRFDEPYGSTGIFGGIGLYRQSAANFDSRSDYGFNAGINADFPLSRRYGVITELAYHWTRGDYDPRFLTLSGGLRISY